MGASYSWNHQDMNRPEQGWLYLQIYIRESIHSVPFTVMMQ